MSMGAVWVVLMLSASAWTGLILQKRFWPSLGWTTVGLLATAVIVACFQLLGYVALVTQYPCFTVMWAALASLGIAVVVSITNRRTVAAVLHGPKMGGHQYDRLSVGFIGVAALFWCCVVAVGLKAGLYGWDSLAYHVPMAAIWHQTGLSYDPSMLPVYGDLSHIDGFSNTPLWPGNMSLFDLLVIGGAGPRLAAVSQAVFGLIAAAYVGNIAAQLGAVRLDRRLATLAFLATPIVVFQSITPYADLFGACWFLAAIYYLLDYLRSPGRSASTLVLLGLCLGLLAGAKFSILPYVALVGSVVVVVALWRAVKQRSARWVSGSVALLLVSGLLVSSFWYVRNWVVIGSPTYPVRLSVAGRQIFPGIDAGGGIYWAKEWQHLQRETTNLAASWLLYPWSSTATDEEDGNGLAFTLLLPGVAVVLASRSARWLTKRRPRDKSYVAVLLLATGTLAIWWKATSHDPRYVLWIYGLVFACGVALVSGLRRRHLLDLRTVVIGAVFLSALTVVAPLAARAQHKGGNPCTYADTPLIGFVASLPAGSTILNDVSTDGSSGASSGLCNAILYGQRLQNRVVWGEHYFDPALGAEALHNVLQRFGVEYIVYFRAPGEPVRPAYADASRYPVVFEERHPVVWTTVHRVQP